MYRDPSLSLVETIRRLEGEVCELRALGGKRLQRRLLVVTVVSMMIATHAVIWCVATRAQAERLGRDSSRRLGGRTSDLIACVQRLHEFEDRPCKR